MDSIIQNIHQISISKRIPGILNGVLGEAHVNAIFKEFFHPCQSSAFGISILTSLKVYVFRRAGDKIQAGFFQVFHQFKGITVVGRAKRTCMAGSCLFADPFHKNKGVEQFQKTALYVIGFITVYIDHSVILQRQIYNTVD